MFLKTTTVTSQPTQEKPAPKTNMDLLGDLGPDTFGPSHVASNFAFLYRNFVKSLSTNLASNIKRV